MRVCTLCDERGNKSGGKETEAGGAGTQVEILNAQVLNHWRNCRSSVVVGFPNVSGAKR